MFTALLAVSLLVLGLALLGFCGSMGCFRHRPKLDAMLAGVCLAGVGLTWLALGVLVSWRVICR